MHSFAHKVDRPLVYWLNMARSRRSRGLACIFWWRAEALAPLLLPFKIAMNLRLTAEFRRLYGLTDQVFEPGASRLALVDGQGCARAMVLALRDPADWSVPVGRVARGAERSGLAGAAIAVNGVDAYELWFSLAAPVPVAQAVLLRGLRERYLAEVKPQRLQMRPSGSDASAQSTPRYPPNKGIGPLGRRSWRQLPAVFGDQPALMPPGRGCAGRIAEPPGKHSVEYSTCRAVQLAAGRRIPSPFCIAASPSRHAIDGPLPTT